MINVVLIEPKGEENIGAISRAMMNMSFHNLILVNPRCNHLSEKSFLYSIHAGDLLKKAVIYNSINNVIMNSDINIAITRRTGAWRHKDLVCNELPVFLNNYQEKTVNLIFGREENGLTNEETQLCDLICSIPSSDEFPSLNLSHAVMVVLYELFSHQNKQLIKIKLANKTSFQNMTTQIFKTLETANFYKNTKPIIIKNFIKRILIRAKLDEQETSIIKNVFKSLDGIFRKSRN